MKDQKFINILQNNHYYFEDFITRSIYHSNAIEGSILTYHETYQLIFCGFSDEPLQNVRVRDFHATINLKNAMKYLFEHLGDTLTSEYIQELEKIVNRNIYNTQSLRTVDELLHTSFQGEDFLYDLADFYIKYERTQPFNDGNGRAGRILLDKLALENGLAPFVIRIEQKDDYMKLLTDGNIAGMKEFINDLMLAEISRMKKFAIT